MDFDTFIGSAWQTHADDPHATARRLRDGAALVADEAQLVQLATLAQHVHGEHLGAWRDGIAFIEGLAALPAFAPDGPSGQALRRCGASLALAADPHAVPAGLPASDRIRVDAMAAASLAERDTGRALALLQRALDRAANAGLPDTDPMHRALAVTANNLASTLEEKTSRSADERALMILAAQAARAHWALAGTWLEVERAEYRLALTWLQAGDAARARGHAQACLDLVDGYNGPALERYFGCEALARADRAAGNAAAHAAALAAAHEAFAALDPSDREWCAASLAALAA